MSTEVSPSCPEVAKIVETVKDVKAKVMAKSLSNDYARSSVAATIDAARTRAKARAAGGAGPTGAFAALW